MNLIEDLRQFDLRTGKTPIDSTRIEGFGPGSSPPPLPEAAPQPPEVASAAEMYGAPFDEPIGPQEPAVSPLVALGQSAREYLTNFQPPNVAGIVPVAQQSFDLYVADAVGRYKGWEVELLEAEQAAIIAVIHGAFRRRMETQFESVTGRPMRRTRTVKKAEAPKRKRAPRAPAEVGVES